MLSNGESMRNNRNRRYWGRSCYQFGAVKLDQCEVGKGSGATKAPVVGDAKALCRESAKPRKGKRAGRGVLFPAVILLWSLTSTWANPMIEGALNRDPGSAAQDEWRFAAGLGYGEMQLDLRATLPFLYTDPSTGKRVIPVLGRALGLTTVGSFELATRGLGPQRLAQLYISNGGFSAGLTLGKANVNFGPLDARLTNAIEGSASGSTNSFFMEYQFLKKNWLRPYIQYSYSGARAHYHVRNAISLVSGAGVYESFPQINADDVSRTHSGRFGVRLSIPIQSWYIGAYVQGSSAHYDITVRTAFGALSAAAGILPANPQSIIDAQYWNNVGAVYAFDTKTHRYNRYGNAGMEFYFDYRRFLSLKIDARRNYDTASWSALGTLLFFFHPNFGIAASALYADPESSQTTKRAYAVGPVFTATF